MRRNGLTRAAAIGALAGTLVFAACTPSEADRIAQHEADLDAIAAASERLMAAIDADDVPGILAELAPDHVTIAPGTPPLDDPASLEAWHADRVALFDSSIEVEWHDIRLGVGLASQRWTSQMTLRSLEGGEPVTGTSRGLWVWERQLDGSWKVLWSIWN